MRGRRRSRRSCPRPSWSARSFPDKEDRKAAKRRLEELKEGDELRDALGAVNQAAVEAMLLAVTLMVSVTATTSAATIVNN